MLLAHVKPKSGQFTYLRIAHYMTSLGFHVKARKGGWSVYSTEPINRD